MELLVLPESHKHNGIFGHYEQADQQESDGNRFDSLLVLVLVCFADVVVVVIDDGLIEILAECGNHPCSRRCSRWN